MVLHQLVFIIMPVYYLTCNHCHGINEVHSEYLTFCSHCEKKITNNFNKWKKENSSKTFEDYKSIVCHTNIYHGEPDSSPPRKKIHFKSNFAYVSLAIIALCLLIIGSIYQGHVITEGIGDWVKTQIQTGGMDHTAWETTKIPDGNFQIKFPSPPLMRKETAETVMGNIEQLVIESDQPTGIDNNLSYEASFVVYPAEMISSTIITMKQTDQFLHHTIENLAREHGSSIISEETVAYGLYPGKEVRLDYNDGMAEIKLRLYLIGNTLYTLKVTSVSQNTNNKDREYFLNSFQLLAYAQASS